MPAQYLHDELHSEHHWTGDHYECEKCRDSFPEPEIDEDTGFCGDCAETVECDDCGELFAPGEVLAGTYTMCKKCAMRSLRQYASS